MQTAPAPSAKITAVSRFGVVSSRNRLWVSAPTIRIFCALPLWMPGVEDVEVELVWDPPWSPELITEDGKRLLGLD